VLKKASQLAF